MAVGSPSTLGGKQLTDNALRLEAIALERVKVFHDKYVVNGGGKMWKTEWKKNLAVTPKLVMERKEVKEQKQSAPRRGKKRKVEVTSPTVVCSLNTSDVCRSTARTTIQTVRRTGAMMWMRSDGTNRVSVKRPTRRRSAVPFAGLTLIRGARSCARSLENERPQLACVPRVYHVRQ
jgi:hypothetical protein